LAIKSPRRFKNRHGIYGVRFLVPKHAQAAVGKKEIRISLRTRDPELARRLALHLSLDFEHRLMASRKHPASNPLRIDYTLDFGNGTKVEVKDESDQKLFLGLLEARPDIAESLTRTSELPGSFAASRPESLADVPSPTQIDLMIDEHLDHLRSMEKLELRTIEEKRRAFGHFTDYLAEHHDLQPLGMIHQITGAMFMGFIKDHAKRPGKGDGEETIDSKTLSKITGHLSKLFDYAIAMQALSLNPATGAKRVLVAGRQSKGTNKKKKYSVLQPSELARIFEPASYLEHMNAGDHFWVPLLGLGTGARMGELVTLRVTDVAPDSKSGVWRLSVKDGVAKNDNSIRQVPIPTKIIELGFLDYRAKLEALGSELLFPFPDIEGETWKMDPSKNLSRKFGLYLDILDIKDRRKVFHSLRHNVCTMMGIKRVPMGDAREIVGHMEQEDELDSFELGRSGRSPFGGDVHLDHYTHAADLEEDGIPVMQRFRGHLDSALVYKLDWDKLAVAAAIVLEHVKHPDPGSPRLKSGWHTNAADYRDEMLRRLAGETRSD